MANNVDVIGGLEDGNGKMVVRVHTDGSLSARPDPDLHPSNQVSPLPAGAIKETSGPTTLTIGAIADGQATKRVGTTFIGYTPTDTTPLTTKGDIFGFDTADARVPVGTDNQVLTADSTQALGVKWATASGGGLTVVPIQNVATSTAISATIPITKLNGPDGQAVTLPVPVTNGFRKTIRNSGDTGGTAAHTITSAVANRIQETDQSINSIVITGENASITLIGDLITAPSTPIWRVECVSTGTNAGAPGTVVINYGG